MDAIFTAKLWKSGDSLVITIPSRENKKEGDLVKVTLEFLVEKEE